MDSSCENIWSHFQILKASRGHWQIHYLVVLSWANTTVSTAHAEYESVCKSPALCVLQTWIIPQMIQLVEKPVIIYFHKRADLWFQKNDRYLSALLRAQKEWGWPVLDYNMCLLSKPIHISIALILCIHFYVYI